MSRGKQHVKKKVFGTLGENRKRQKRKQRVGGIPIGLLASIAAPVLSEVQNQYLVKVLVGAIDEKDERKNSIKNKNES